MNHSMQKNKKQRKKKKELKSPCMFSLNSFEIKVTNYFFVSGVNVSFIVLKIYFKIEKKKKCVERAWILEKNDGYAPFFE